MTHQNAAGSNRRIALIGAGAIGTITGSFISEAGYDIELFDSNRDQVDVLNQTGARLTGFLDKQVPVVAKTPDEACGQYDLVLLITKQLHTEEALAPFIDLLGDDGFVCTLQNGTPEDQVSAIVGRDRTIAGNVQFSGVWEGLGKSRLATTWEQVQKLAFDVGELDGQVTDRVREVASILSVVGHCEITSNISGHKWAKLVLNASFSGLSTALGCSFGAVMEHPVTANSLIRIVDESIRAGLAHGLEVGELGGVSARQLLLTGGWTEDKILEFWTQFIEMSGNGEASMLQDLRKGNRSEVDFINGHVIDIARAHGVDVPFNDVVYELITTAQATSSVPTFEPGIERFKALLEDRSSPTA